MVNEQSFWGVTLNLGTSIEGKYLYAVPLLYYSTMEKNIDPFKSSGFNIGLGYGLAYLQADGMYVNTKLYASDSLSKKNISVRELGDIAQMFISYQIRGFHLGFKLLGADFKQGDADNNIFSVNEAGFDLGYMLYF